MSSKQKSQFTIQSSVITLLIMFGSLSISHISCTSNSSGQTTESLQNGIEHQADSKELTREKAKALISPTYPKVNTAWVSLFDYYGHGDQPQPILRKLRDWGIVTFDSVPYEGPGGHWGQVIYSSGMLTEKGKTFLFNPKPHSDNKTYITSTVAFNEITGIKYSPVSNNVAEVEYTTIVVSVTAFAIIYNRPIDKMGAVSKASAVFEKYDDGWRRSNQ